MYKLYVAHSFHVKKCSVSAFSDCFMQVFREKKKFLLLYFRACCNTFLSSVYPVQHGPFLRDAQLVRLLPCPANVLQRVSGGLVWGHVTWAVLWRYVCSPLLPGEQQPHFSFVFAPIPKYCHPLLKSCVCNEQIHTSEVSERTVVRRLLFMRIIGFVRTSLMFECQEVILSQLWLSRNAWLWQLMLLTQMWWHLCCVEWWRSLRLCKSC